MMNWLSFADSTLCCQTSVSKNLYIVFVYYFPWVKNDCSALLWQGWTVSLLWQFFFFPLYEKKTLHWTQDCVEMLERHWFAPELKKDSGSETVVFTIFLYYFEVNLFCIRYNTYYQVLSFNLIVELLWSLYLSLMEQRLKLWRFCLHCDPFRKLNPWFDKPGPRDPGSVLTVMPDAPPERCCSCRLLSRTFVWGLLQNELDANSFGGLQTLYLAFC